MRAAEVAADDVRLSLASAEEPASLGSEFGLVAGSVLLGQTVLVKCIRPLVLGADIAFTENRFPLRRTTDVLPFSPQVRPVSWLERISTWSAKRISPLSFIA
ncbi:hypothetical protein ACPC27_10705 [Streptomyces cellulosae]